MTTTFGAQLAPHLNRLALCIHRPTSRRPEFRELVDRLQLGGGSIVVSAARFVASGRVTARDVELMGRYESRGLVAANLAYHVEQGFLTEHGDGFVPSPPFQEASQLTLDLQGESGQEIWTDHLDSLGELTATAERVLDAALEAAPVAIDALRGQIATRSVLPTTAAGQFLGRMTELRYLRSDLHAAALAGNGFVGPRARSVGRLWKGHQVEAAQGEALVEKGLALRAGDGFVLTPEARRARDDAEVETDRLTDATFAAIGEATREGFLSALPALPGDDPRPLEDR